MRANSKWVLTHMLGWAIGGAILGFASGTDTWPVTLAGLMFGASMLVTGEAKR